MFQGWKEAHVAARLSETYRNWVLYNFHFQQILLKMYSNPRTCAEIETWSPKWKKLKLDIANRKGKIARSFASDLI